MLDLLGRAGCVSIEAGVESLTEAGRAALDKRCRMTTDELAERLIHARRSVPFVQANLIETHEDEAELWSTAWRARLHAGTASGPTTRCRSIPIPARPTTGACGACPTSGRGSAPMIITSRSSPASATSRTKRPLPLHRAGSLLPRAADAGVTRACPDHRRRRRDLDLRARPWPRCMSARPGYRRDAWRQSGPAGLRAARRGDANAENRHPRSGRPGMPLDWRAGHPRRNCWCAAARRWRPRDRQFAADLMHAQSRPRSAARRPLPRQPAVAVCHSCVATWWRAVRLRAAGATSPGAPRCRPQGYRRRRCWWPWRRPPPSLRGDTREDL